MWDYIATRSLFPSTFKAAVRQKARWVYGITMQSASLRDVFGESALTFAERTFLYKDLKAKFANFVLLPGYVVLLYFLVQTFVPRLELPIMYPLFSPSWWLCAFLLFMMVERQVLRGRALVNVYGWKTMVFSVLLPPLFPLRLLWGNLINLFATFRAWKLKGANVLLRWRERNAAEGAQGSSASADRSHQHKKPSGEAAIEHVESPLIPVASAARPVWNKTDHEFLPESVLVRYRRLLGDTLLERGAVTPEILECALDSAQAHGVLLGRQLLHDGFVQECHLTQAYALQQQSMFVKATSALVQPRLINHIPRAAIESFVVLPLAASKKGLIVVVDDDLSIRERQDLAALLGEPTFFLFSCTADLFATFSGVAHLGGEDAECSQFSPGEATTRLLDETQVTLAQAGMALAYALHLDRSVESIVHEMGLALSRGASKQDRH